MRNTTTEVSIIRLCPRIMDGCVRNAATPANGAAADDAAAEEDADEFGAVLSPPPPAPASDDEGGEDADVQCLTERVSIL